MESKNQRKTIPYNRFVNRLNLRFIDLLLVTLFLITLTIGTRFSLLSNLTENYISGNNGDAGLYTWLFKFNISQILSEGWFNTATFYPYTETLAWSDNFLLPAFIGKIFQFMGVGTILSYNLMLLITTFLNGFCAFLLCKQLTGRNGTALIGATLFLTYSYLTFQLGHTQLQFAFWLPLSCFLLLYYFSSDSFLAAVLLGLSLAGTFLCGAYYAIFNAILISFLFICVICVRPQTFNSKKITKLIAGSLCGFIVIIPFAIPYIDVRATFGERHLYEPQAYGASIISYFTANHLNYLYGFTSNYSHPEARLFPGILVILLSCYILKRLNIEALRRYNLLGVIILASLLISSAYLPILDHKAEASVARYICILSSWIYFVFGLLYLYKLGKIEYNHGANYLTNRSIIAIFHYLTVLFFILSLGPIWPPKELSNLPALFTPFFHLFPGMNAIRAVSRLGVVVILGIAVLSSFATLYLFNSSKKRNIFVAFALCIITAENLCPHIPYSEPEKQIPAIFKKAGKLSLSGDIAIVLPLTTTLRKTGAVGSWRDFATHNINAMHIASTAGLKVFNGYSGQVTRLMKDYPRKMANFPDDRSIKALLTISGFRFVLFNKYDEPTFDDEKFGERLHSFNTTIKKLGEDSSGWMLFEIIPDFKITDDFFLQVPSYPKGKLNLNLRTEIETKEPLDVSLFLKTHAEKYPFYTMKLPSDTKWHNFIIPLPVTSDKVRPLKVMIKVKNHETIYLGKNKFIKDN